jgi:hypothetical protein
LKSFIDQDGKFNQANIMKSYIHAQKQMGKDKVIIPNDKSTPEELKEFNKKMGWVENEAEYKFGKQLDEKVVAKEFVDSFRKFAHSSGMPVKQAEKMLDFFESTTVEGKKAAEAAEAKEWETGLNNLKSKWGNAYDRKIMAANSFVDKLGGEEFKKHINEKGYVADAKFVEFMADLYEKIEGEDNTLGNELKSSDRITPSEAKDQINEMMANPKGAYLDHMHPGHKEAVEKMLKLHTLTGGN